MTEEREQQYREEIERVIAAGPYRDDWDSLFQFMLPEWFPKAKFGIFIHWGLYSIPAHRNEWYSRNMYIQSKEEWEHHRKTYGPHAQFGYKDFIPMFTAEKFHPEEWAELFREAGAEYVFPVAEHHDGFQMYRSEISHYNAYEMGPHRDVLGELKTAIEAQGMKFCTSTHRAEHWFFMGHGKEFESDIKEPMKRGDFYWPAMQEPADHHDLKSQPYPSEEFLDDWILRTCELIDRYQPELLYFDWWIQHEAFKPGLKKIAAYYYNRGKEWGKQVAICYKHDAMMFGSGIVEVERGALAEPKAFPWQTDTAIAKNAWCYTDSLEYKTPGQIIRNFIEIITKNGNMLLNVGPKGDGEIAEEDKRILKEIGQWMKTNAQAIYGSKPWRKDAEGSVRVQPGQFTDNVELPYTREDIRFMANGDSVYVFVMKYPDDGSLLIRSLGEAEDKNLPEFHGLIQKISVLGFEEAKVTYQRDLEGLKLQISGVHTDLPLVLRVKLA